MDFLTKKKRSALMSHVRGKNTKPELAVRRIVRRLGYTFRMYDQSLPARPDLVFPSMQKVIFIHGCFWHRHYRCQKATMPKTRVAFWRNKFKQNKLRDRSKLKQLRGQGWKALTVWECETRFPEKIRDRIQQYLETPE
jgi:DNA mismatch endonuclease, patch repair protein